MRKYLIVLSMASFLAPQAALACSSMSKSSITVSCQSGVKIYRGTPLSAPQIPVQLVQSQASAQALAAQQALIASQDRRIDGLERDLERADRPRRRGRSRNFSAPIGAFGRGVGSGFGGRINSRLGGSINFSRGGAFGRRRF